MSRKTIRLRHFVSDESGNLAITFGLISMISVAAVGGALDFGKSYNMRSKMQNALDSAVVSGLSQYRETGDWAAAQAKAESVFQAHFTNTLIWNASNPTGGLDQPVLQIVPVNGKLTASATATVNTPFMHLVIGKNYQILSVASGEPQSGKKLEVAIMADVTGSMGATAGSGGSITSCTWKSNPSTKLDFLKCAAEDLVNILLPTSGINSQTVRIGVVPFADYVNAGEYADNVTGLPATGGAYQPLTNLSQTKQRSVFSGTYSGFTAGGSGSQYGTVASVGNPGTSGAVSSSTFNNNYCSGAQATPRPARTLTLDPANDNGNATPQLSKLYYPKANGTTRPIMFEVPRDNDNYASTNTNTWTDATSVPGLIWQSNGSNDNWFSLYGIQADDNNKLYYQLQGWAETKGYFAIIPQSTTGLTIRQRSSGGNSGDVGVRINVENNSVARAAVPPSFKRVGTGPGEVAGYWRLKKLYDNSGWLTNTRSEAWEWRHTGNANGEYFQPIYENVMTEQAGCETGTTTASSKLITCVTERVNTSGATIVTQGSTVSSLNYDDDAPASGKYVGPYNHGNASKYNYSADGKCWVSGRELPSVQPLTNNRTALENLFKGATAGGATPGHLGTAWAGYLLSPSWSSVWPAASAPVDYSDTGTIKAAILMTDGEYNLQFSMAGSTSATSAKQALLHCKALRDRGIHVYTIGFGFEANATPPSPNVEGMTDAERTTVGGTDTKSRALDVLAKCASSNSSYKFPYDGQALRQAFKDIASSLDAAAKGSSSLITN